jgi:hypothetical protein
LAQAQALGVDFKPPEVDPSAPCAQFETWVERLPSDYAESVAGGVLDPQRTANRATLQRFVRDNIRKAYVRYAITVEALPQAGTYRVSFEDSNAGLPSDVKGDWKVVSPPRYPAPQVVQDGDEIPLELMTYGSGAQLVDYIHVGEIDKMPKRKDAARDSYAEDAEFTLARPRLRVNGVARDSVAFPEMLRGEVLWLYVPGEGRYIVSFSPHQDQGFAKVGEVQGALMTLLVGPNLLRIESTDRIAQGGGVYNVYGLRDAAWEPADPLDRGRFMAGTSPGVETAVGR